MSEKHRFSFTSYPLPKNAQGKTFYDKAPGYVRLGCAFMRDRLGTGFALLF
jgi:hypothetical protein